MVIPPIQFTIPKFLNHGQWLFAGVVIAPSSPKGIDSATIVLSSQERVPALAESVPIACAIVTVRHPYLNQDLNFSASLAMFTSVRVV